MSDLKIGRRRSDGLWVLMGPRCIVGVLPTCEAAREHRRLIAELPRLNTGVA